MLVFLLACKPPSPDATVYDVADTAAADTATHAPPLASTGVLIIGGGASGLSAAVTALDAGADVLLIERDPALGGSSSYPISYFGVGTRWQADQGVTDSPELALDEWAAFTNGGDPSHPWVQNFLYDAAENLEWLCGYGAEFGQLADEPVGSVLRVHSLTPTDQGHPFTVMAALVAEHAWLNTTGVGLVERDGAIVGVEVEQPDGTVGWIAAGAVIVATGGFARSDDRVYAALPQLKALPRHAGARPTTDGNGLTLIEAAGGALENLEHIAVYGHSTTDARHGAPEAMLVVGVEAGLVVSGAGVRVLNEDHLRTVWGGRAALEHGQLYGIYDAPKWGALMMHGFSYNYDSFAEGQLTPDAYAALSDVPRASTVQELGAVLGVDGALLQQTLADYNALIEAGEDTAFGRDTAGITPVRTPPYYALPLAAATGKSFGGAALGTDGAVLDVDGVAIPGLFAAGEVAGVLGGKHLGMGITGSISPVVYTGRIAGASAAAYAQR